MLEYANLKDRPEISSVTQILRHADELSDIYY